MEKKKISYKFLIGGLFFVLFGSCLLLWTTEYLSLLGSLLPAVLLFFGSFLIYLIFIRGIKDIYVFPAVIMILFGIFLLFQKKILPSGEILKVWPLFMTAFGAALFVFAFRVKGGNRIKLLVPSSTLIVLSFIFLPFSLGIVNISFAQFVVKWWPVHFLVLGIVSIVLHIKNIKKGE